MVCLPPSLITEYCKTSAKNAKLSCKIYAICFLFYIISLKYRLKDIIYLFYLTWFSQNSGRILNKLSLCHKLFFLILKSLKTKVVYLSLYQKSIPLINGRVLKCHLCNIWHKCEIYNNLLIIMSLKFKFVQKTQFFYRRPYKKMEGARFYERWSIYRLPL